MLVGREKGLGRFTVEFELANNDDVAAVRRGDLTPEKVRRVKILRLVDSGASHLVLPSKVAKELGLPVTGKVKVTYANGRSSRRDLVEAVYVELLGRHSVFRAFLEPKRETALIGALVLEDLDFLIDPLKQRLYPRDPKGEIVEIG